MSFLGKQAAFSLAVVASLLVSCGSNRKPEPDIGQYQNHGDRSAAEINPDYTMEIIELTEKRQRELKKLKK